MSDSFLDELPITTPDRIDIYVDGCTLGKGRVNPYVAGGWGAVVVESRAGEIASCWRASGQIAQSNSRYAENIAALHGLKAASARLESLSGENKNLKIVLHTDQIDMKSSVETIIESRKPHDPNRPPWLHDLAALAEKTGANIDFTRASKSYKGRFPPPETKFMDVAHDLASIAAYEERLQEQGYLGRPPTRRLERAEAEALIRDMKTTAEAAWCAIAQSDEINEDIKSRKDTPPRAVGGKMERSLSEDVLDEIRLLRASRKYCSGNDTDRSR